DLLRRGAGADGGPAGLIHGLVDAIRNPAPLSPVLKGEGLGVRGGVWRGSSPGPCPDPLTPNPSPPSTGARGGRKPDRVWGCKGSPAGLGPGCPFLDFSCPGEGSPRGSLTRGQRRRAAGRSGLSGASSLCSVGAAV